MQLSMQTKFVQKYTATSQESNDRVTPLFKRLASVWYTVAIRLVVNPIGLKTQVNYVALIVKCRNGI